MRAVALVCFAASAVSAQTVQPLLDGALEPTQDLGCIRYEALEPTQTAADLALAAQSCLADSAFDAAVTSFIAMQVFGVFDAQRVLDTSAHQAVALLGQNIALSMDETQQAEFQKAVVRFGGAGSDGHISLCAKLREIGAPDYFPRYMTQQGQEAFLYPDDDPLVPDFEPGPAWEAVLTNFLKCG